MPFVLDALTGRFAWLLRHFRHRDLLMDVREFTVDDREFTEKIVDVKVE